METEEQIKLSPSQRRDETDRAFLAIMEEERRTRSEKNARLREMRLARAADKG